MTTTYKLGVTVLDKWTVYLMPETLRYSATNGRARLFMSPKRTAEEAEGARRIPGRTAMTTLDHSTLDVFATAAEHGLYVSDRPSVYNSAFKFEVSGKGWLGDVLVARHTGRITKADFLDDRNRPHLANGARAAMALIAKIGAQ